MKRFVSVKIYVLTVVILIVCFCVFFLVREKKIEKENVKEDSVYMFCCDIDGCYIYCYNV